MMKNGNNAPLVMKFGGTSVEDASAFQRLTAIVKMQDSGPKTIVVSAMSRVTDTLLAGIHHAACGCLEQAVGEIELQMHRYLQVAQALLGAKRIAESESRLAAALSGIAELLRVIAAHPVTRKLLQDEIVSHGERLSAMLLADVLQESGIAAEYVDARRCLITNEEHGCAAPVLEECMLRTRAELEPLIKQGRIPVLEGFIGATRSGATTTLGRGGSDYTAALVGAALDASEIQIWTDVTGVLTADPRVAKRSRTIARLSYAEAAELAYFGAKVLHPKTIQPAVEGRIPVRICNSRRPEEAGTLVTADAEMLPGAAKAIAHKKGITVLQVSSARMLGAYGFLRTLFKIFDRHRTVVDVVTTSEVSVSLSIDSTDSLSSLLPELSQLGTVEVQSGRAIICVVGQGLSSTPGIAAQIFSTISDINILLISQGASKINLTFVVEEERADEVVARLHAAFFENDVR